MRKLLFLLIITSFVTNCSVFSSYSTHSNSLLSEYKTANFKQTPPKKSDTLDNMQQGLIKRDLNNYSTSNDYLNTALDNSNAWLGGFAGDISEKTATTLLNDNITNYHVKDYEATMLTTFIALNFLDLDNLNDARVAIKQTYQLEQQIQNKNSKLYSLNKSNIPLRNEAMRRIEQNSPKDPKLAKAMRLKNSYQNAFSHYLTGFIFEQLGEPSLSRPGYLKALELNPHNQLARSAITNLDNPTRAKPNTTQVLLVEELGHAPEYKSKNINIPFNANLYNRNANCINSLNIFYPILKYDTSVPSKAYSIRVDSEMYQPELITDIDLMSARTLKDNMPHIIARNISANIRNIIVSQSVCSAAGGNLGTILSAATTIGSVFIDRADERTWSLLPSKIYIDRFSLPYGRHTLNLNINGNSITKTIELNKPYQVLTVRVIQGRVFFN